VSAADRLLGELQRAATEERPDVVLQALHIGCGAFALVAMGVPVQEIHDALNGPPRGASDKRVDPDVIYARSSRRKIPQEHRPGYGQGSAKTKRRNREVRQQADRELERLGLKPRTT
jgi:hypothetical protein